LTVRDLVGLVYPALAAGDRDALLDLLDPEFEATLTEGLPFGIGGTHRGAVAAQRDGWWAIGRAFDLRAEPQEWIDCADGRLLVTGRYRGRVRSSGAAVDAAFAHLWTARDGHLTRLWQLTDSARWIDHQGADT
jgi:2-(1,2-epoxy-1,2-dihydrophenyl)acetyl-CoA isomerase